MPNKVKAVIFDVDGTLVDSRELIYSAFEDVLAAHDIQVTRQQIGGLVGKPVQGMYKILAPELDPAELEAAHLAHHEGTLHQPKMYEGVKETLRILQPKHKLGVFTGFDKTTYERLDLLGIKDYFESIVENSMYTAHKPDPEGLLLCMDQLETTDPQQVVYIGDGVTDIMAGKNAGVNATIGVTYGFSTREILQKAGADYIVDSITELSGIIGKINGDGS